ncbi:MAG TPA: AmmeMemoRadiSam system protein A [Gammaproteobacteria bacterium]
MPSTDGVYPPEQRALLLYLARASIVHGLRSGEPLAPVLEALPAALREPRAVFVTLQRGGQLRGCIGSLQAHRPLANDVAANAFAAAFRDPRFPPLGAGEYPQLELHLSVLSPATPLAFASEAALLAQLRPGVDGLILSDGGRRGTFLPSVWEQLPEPAQFLAHLKRKAGLPESYWSETLQVERYTTESFA